jgi:hypothetical protein
MLTILKSAEVRETEYGTQLLRCSISGTYLRIRTVSEIMLDNG